MNQAEIQAYLTGDAMMRQLDRRRKLLAALQGTAGYGVGGGRGRGMAPLGRGRGMGRIPDQALAAILGNPGRGGGFGKKELPVDMGQYNPNAQLMPLVATAAPTAAYRALYR